MLCSFGLEADPGQKGYQLGLMAASAVDLARGGHDMSRTGISIGPEDPRQADIRRMIAESDAMMQALYPAESNHLVDVDALASPDALFLAARRDGLLLGSIASRIIAPSHAEMKRLFVRRDARGLGLGRRLLQALEEAARRQRVDRISLETGIRQPEAIGLYRSSGYQDCPPFGSYEPDPLSLFMTKRL
jgi:putative acetyltransferase